MCGENFYTTSLYQTLGSHYLSNSIGPKYNPNPIPLEASLVGCFTFLIFITRHKIVDGYGMIFLTFQGTTWF